ncbi:uncharacterized protein [Typha latifolia]|uniref:uncharacterized protein n=1 Tax=Typha latifolia TaxID=4733 RepID=UPI003C30100B
MRNSVANRTVEAEGEEEEEFYESLDRILSSSCSSTSASDDDADHHHPQHHHLRRRSSHRLPPPSAASSAASYDIWISEPSSVEERRRRLLHQMGLAPATTPTVDVASTPPVVPLDDTPSRRQPGRSVSCDEPHRLPDPLESAPFIRSRSDGAVNDPNLVAPPPLSIESLARSEGLAKNPSSDDGGDGGDQAQCRIKNLDDGREFVVEEFREDGTWNKVREVGTNRQLTMEEFGLRVGRSPIVQELMRRQNVEDSSNGGGSVNPGMGMKAGSNPAGGRSKKKGGWLRSIKNMAGYHKHSQSSDDKDTSSEKGGRRLSSATDDSLEGSRFGGGHERIRIRQYGKSYKELTGVFMSQEIEAHSGSIWCIKFSLDGRYLATAGEDCVIHVWEVVESEKKRELFGEGAAGENGSCNPFLLAMGDGSPEMALSLSCIEGVHGEKKRRAKVPSIRKSVSSDHLIVPEKIFALAEKPICSFRGHVDDVLDLSWSKSQYLLSSSMDKTVRLWHITSNVCLKAFTHSDYVTCIQFNPVDDRFFISGSLDEKVRIWSIPDRQVVDWNDLHEMVTAACYTPDGKGALVGTHKGSCHLFDTSENKLHYKSQIDLRIKKKKSNHKKITGFQFAPGSSSEVLITSADSRIRVVNGVELVHKFKGYRNTSSQISASFASNGKYVICASEDSHVYVWRYDHNTQPGRNKGVVNVTQSYEHFHCRDVTVAVTWPGSSTGILPGVHSSRRNDLDGIANSEQEVLAENNELHSLLPVYRCTNSPLHNSIINASTNHLGDRNSATWPEEKLLASKCNTESTPDLCSVAMDMQRRSAWGLVIVTAGRGGEIRVFQNFGFPVHA